MICIGFCVIYKYRVKQLMIFERTVAAASDFKNCTMVNRIFLAKGRLIYILRLYI